MESCSVDLQHGVCQVFAGFGYITFDGVILPHHGACTYVVSALASKAGRDYTLLLSFKKDTDGNFTIFRLVWHLPSLEVSIDPETLWKIQVSCAVFDCMCNGCLDDVKLNRINACR